MNMLVVTTALTICWEARMVARRKWTPKAEAIVAVMAGQSGDATRDALRDAREEWKFSDDAIASKRLQLAKDEPELLLDLPTGQAALTARDVELAALDAQLVRQREAIEDERARIAAQLVEEWTKKMKPKRRRPEAT